MQNKNFKTKNWNALPLYKKIEIYGRSLTKDFAFYVNKLSAKQYINDNFSDKLKTAKLVRVLKDINDIKESDLNTNHIIKSVHGSGWNIPITKQTTVQNVKDKLKSWNKCYSTTEKQYTYISPQFFIEEKIEDSILKRTDLLYEYKLRCVNGKPLAMQVLLDGKENIYDLNWNLLEPPQMQNIAKPKLFDQIIEMSKILSAQFEFVRMDFNIGVGDVLYFSEWTFTPNGGRIAFSEELEMKFGKEWI